MGSNYCSDFNVLTSLQSGYLDSFVCFKDEEIVAWCNCFLLIVGSIGFPVFPCS